MVGEKLSILKCTEQLHCETRPTRGGSRVPQGETGWWAQAGWTCVSQGKLVPSMPPSLAYHLPLYSKMLNLRQVKKQFIHSCLDLPGLKSNLWFGRGRRLDVK